MLRICFVHINPITTYNSHYALLPAIHMREVLQGHAEVHVLYSGCVDPNTAGYESLQLHRYCGREHGARSIPAIRYAILAYKVCRLAREQKIDIFLNTWKHYCLFPIIVGAKLGGSRVIARVVGVPISSVFRKGRGAWNHMRKKVGFTLERWSLYAADHVLAISEYLRIVEIRRGIPASRITVIPPGVNVERFCAAPRIKRTCGQRVLFVGRLDKNKGVEVLLEAWRLVVKAVTNEPVCIIDNLLY